MARRLGATQDMLDSVIGGTYRGMQSGWIAALRYADAMTPTGSVPDAAAFSLLREHWDDSQVVEITAVIGLFNYFNRFANALDIPPTR